MNRDGGASINDLETDLIRKGKLPQPKPAKNRPPNIIEDLLGGPKEIPGAEKLREKVRELEVLMLALKDPELKDKAAVLLTKKSDD